MPQSTELQLNGGAHELTLTDCVKGPTFAALVRGNGGGPVMAMLTKELLRVSNVCGGGIAPDTVASMAELVMERWKFRTVNSFRVAIRDGLNSGKIYGKLTYPVLAEWLNAFEDRFEAHSYSQHLGSK